jgi:peptidoglycan/xylan/chitin deacetylase (PgdA/CDA1 family)
VPAGRVLLYAATAAALALVARSIVLGPIPLVLASLALAAYLAIVLAGVLSPRLEMFADVTWRGPEGARGVALTFDDGPSPEHTPRVLELLDRAKVRATFFVIGHKAERHPELVRAIAARGHAIGVHGHAHARLFSLWSYGAVRADLERATAALEAITGERPALFRPPIGHTNPRIAKAARELELEIVGWSVRALDGLARAKSDEVARRVARGLDDGAIVLLHDAAERDDHVPASLAALPRILEVMRDRRLEGVRVDAWTHEVDDEARPAA